MPAIKDILSGVQKNVSLKDHTTFKIGGPAKYFFVAKKEDDILKALNAARACKLPVFILGGGSKLLVSDKGFNGLVIKIDILGVKIQKNEAFVGAGVGLTKLANFLAGQGLSGLEWAAGIPRGTVGGAIYGHAQAFGVKISDAVKEVEALDLKTLKIKKFTKEQCKFSLKSSIFKNPPAGGKNFIIVSAVLRFEKEDSGKIKNQIKEFLQYRKNSHPLKLPSAGSTFVNSEKKIKNKKLLEKFPELNEYNRRGSIPSGYLISKCGISGKKIGKAQISEKHANFIVNLGGAKAKDVLALIKLAKKEVKKVFSIDLEPEVQFVGF